MKDYPDDELAARRIAKAACDTGDARTAGLRRTFADELVEMLRASGPSRPLPPGVRMMLDRGDRGYLGMPRFVNLDGVECDPHTGELLLTPPPLNPDVAASLSSDVVPSELLDHEDRGTLAAEAAALFSSWFGAEGDGADAWAARLEKANPLRRTWTEADADAFVLEILRKSGAVESAEDEMRILEEFRQDRRNDSGRNGGSGGGGVFIGDG